MLYEFQLRTERENFYNITEQVRAAVEKSRIRDGICVVCCPHTTAGITINENADPDVVHDLLLGLGDIFENRQGFLHGEGNSDAHLKASYTGSSATVILDRGRLVLGTWQGIYFCEFDGPRQRHFFVKVLRG